MSLRLAGYPKTPGFDVQFRPLATGASQQQARPCPLCPESGSIFGTLAAPLRPSRFDVTATRNSNSQTVGTHGHSVGIDHRHDEIAANHLALIQPASIRQRLGVNGSRALEEAPGSLPQQRDRNQQHQNVGDLVELFGRRFAHQPNTEKIADDRDRQQDHRGDEIARAKTGPAQNTARSSSD